MELLIFLAVVAYFTKTGIEDLSFAVRGKTSPRMAARAARSRARTAAGGGRGAARNYLSELWSDSWQSASAGHQRRRTARQARPPKSQRPTGPARAYLGRRASGAHAAVSRRWGNTWERAEARHQRRHERHHPTTPDTAVAAVPVADTEPATDPDGGDPQTPEAEPSGAPATPTTTEGENDMAASNGGGEVTGLQTAITYADGLATELEAVPTATEQLQASLQAGDVGNDTVAKFASIAEHATAAASAAREAANELRTHLSVTEAYASTGDQAGSKEFVTTE